MIRARGDAELRRARSISEERNESTARAARKLLIAAVLLAFGFFGGCGAAKPSKYYQLTVPASVLPVEKADAVPITLLLGPIMTSHLYREDRIVYGNGGDELGLYEYQRWAEPPAEMIQDVLLRELRNSGRYQAVYFRRSGIQGDFAVRGRLYDFKEVDGSQLFARISFEMEMRNLRTGVTVWTHYYSHDEPVASKNVNAVVSALDQGVKRGVAEMLASLDQYFASHPVK
jgi:ABC-type uncharacterized transport system auxiliary subunit